MFSAFFNSFKIPDLRKRIVFTLAMLAVCRIGAWIPVPGIDTKVIHDWLQQQAQSQGASTLLGMYDLFVGGALYQGSVTAMGIMPYISASIIMQLMTAVWPTLARLAREGDVGRAKITQYSRLLAVAICIFQGFILTLGYENPARLDRSLHGLTLVPHPGMSFQLTAVLTLTTASMLMMWIGEQISQRGIGNGVSLVITVGIVARLPKAVFSGFEMAIKHLLPVITLILLLLLAIAVIAGIIAVTQAQRKIPIQHAKRIVGQKMMVGSQSFMPLRLNYSGVMPIIFAQAIIMLPQQLFALWPDGWVLSSEMHHWAGSLGRGNFSYYFINVTLIFVFSYFWVATQFKPVEIADDLKKYGSYVPGIRPGQPTADFLDHAMNRLTLAGAIFLIIIAVIPDWLALGRGVPYSVAQFVGGTSMLIAVGVMLDTMRQIESQLLMRHYDGFLRKGRLRGRASFGGASGAGRAPLLGDATTRVIVIAFVVTAVITAAAVLWSLFMKH